jgi:hypothetical protein
MNIDRISIGRQNKNYGVTLRNILLFPSVFASNSWNFFFSNIHPDPDDIHLVSAKQARRWFF